MPITTSYLKENPDGTGEGSDRPGNEDKEREPEDGKDWVGGHGCSRVGECEMSCSCEGMVLKEKCRLLSRSAEADFKSNTFLSGLIRAVQYENSR